VERACEEASGACRRAGMITRLSRTVRSRLENFGVVSSHQVLALCDLIDELIHAIEETLDCKQGTVLCKDCRRLLKHVGLR
jgi:hypothetical protein